ncbi:MAG: N-acetyltransferase family protein [Haloferacaceae archaeon]
MSGTRIFPDEAAGPFPTPPRTVVDRADREVRLVAVSEDGGDDEDALSTDRALEALTEMYVDFDPSDRAQGLPPAGERRIRDWLENVLGADTVNVVAMVDDEAAGHATLVPDSDAYELAIFVHQDYQDAGVGTALLRTLLGHAASEGIERVWLTVERWNAPAISLYEKVGFETSNAENFEREMAVRLQTDSTG